MPKNKTVPGEDIMKKIVLIMFVFVIAVSSISALEGKSMLTGEFGFNYFAYKTLYLSTGVVYQVEVIEGMDIVGGADFGINTETGTSGEINANFLIPLKLGIYFPFQVEKIEYGFGTGITPTFQKTYDGSGAGFLIGPYINGSIRIKVHPVMSVYMQFQQDLLFGKPDWIYTGSRINIGISF